MALASGEVNSGGFVRDADGRQAVTVVGGITSNPSRPSSAKTPKGKVTAKTSSETLAAANESRVALYVTNVGANNVFLALGATAVAEEGILLTKEGGGTVIDNYSGAVAVITKSGESVVSLSEV
jgi:hypothetical protein